MYAYCVYVCVCISVYYPWLQMLAEMRLLDAIETLWNVEDPEVLYITNDIFSFIVEANPSMVREFCLSEAKLGQVGPHSIYPTGCKHSSELYFFISFDL